VFHHPTFTAFAALTVGVIAAPSRRTVCGMLTAARLGGAWHHSRAHRFFASVRWSLDRVGVVMLGLVIGWLTPTSAPLLIAVDDTLFRRSGKNVHDAVWAYDGSRRVAAGQAKLSKGVTFAVVVELPFVADATTGKQVTVTRYGRTATVTVHACGSIQTCCSSMVGRSSRAQDNP
jgi:hypothetical protein